MQQFDGSRARNSGPTRQAIVSEPRSHQAGRTCVQELAVTGTIRFYLPKTRDGVVQTEDGQDVLFHLGHDGLDLHGGDIVDFQPVPGRPMILQNVTVRRRWAEALAHEYRPLVNEFHSLLRIRA